MLERLNMQRQSGGFTLYVVLAIIFGFFVLVAVRSFPIIFDGLSVQEGMEELTTNTLLRKDLKPRTIKKAFNRFLNLNEIDYPNGEMLLITKSKVKDGYDVVLNYDVLVPLYLQDKSLKHKVINAEIKYSFRNAVFIPRL